MAHSAGNYYVTVTDLNGCTVESNHLAINVHPQPPVSISVNGDTLNAYNAVAYQWYRNNNIINGATSSIYIVTQAGSYTVAISDSNGCVATSNVIVIAGIAELSSNYSIIVYPNPANNQLNINLGNLQAEQVCIYNATGQLLSEVKQPTGNRLDISSLATGVYIAEIKVQGVVQRVRWVKM